MPGVEHPRLNLRVNTLALKKLGCHATTLFTSQLSKSYQAHQCVRCRTRTIYLVRVIPQALAFVPKLMKLPFRCQREFCATSRIVSYENITKGNSTNNFNHLNYVDNYIYNLLNIERTLHSAHTVYSCVPYDSHNKQRLFP
jgi:hypothetical protein